jgi:hypothetical protein
VNTPFTGLLRQKRQRGFLRDFVLAAEIAADDGANDADAAHRQLQRARYVGAGERNAPDGRVNGEAAIGIPIGDGGVRFERHVFDHLRVEAGFEDSVGLGKSLLDVAFADHLGRINVAVGRVDLGAILAHGRDRIEHGRQRLVFDHDLRQGLVGDLFSDGRHRRNAVAGVADDRIGEHRLILKRRPEGIGENFRAGEHRHHAGHGLGRAGIDTLDAGGSDAGALDARIKHAGKTEIVDVFGLPEAVQAGIRPRRALADRAGLLASVRRQRLDREWLARHHRRQPQIDVGRTQRLGDLQLIAFQDSAVFVHGAIASVRAWVSWARDSSRSRRAASCTASIILV